MLQGGEGLGEWASGRRILVVDDDEDARTTIAEVLGEEGYRVEVAADGADALERLRIGPRPALVLLDLMMPSMNGWQFCSEWRRDEALSDIPVVVLSASPAAREKALALGATGFLEKPIKLDHLLDAVEQFGRAV